MFIRHSEAGHEARKKGDLCGRPVPYRFQKRLIGARHHRRSVLHLRHGSHHPRSEPLRSIHQNSAGPSTSLAIRNCGWCTSDWVHSCGLNRRTHPMDTKRDCCPNRRRYPSGPQRRTTSRSTLARRGSCNRPAAVTAIRKPGTWTTMSCRVNCSAEQRAATALTDATEPIAAVSRWARGSYSSPAAAVRADCSPLVLRSSRVERWSPERGCSLHRYCYG
jgi:hypothetical protein